MARLSLIVGLALIGVTPSFAPAQTTVEPQTGIANPSTGAATFPANPNCTNFTPCTNVTGEILRIEESYWVRDLNGREVRLKVNSDARMKELPKVGDKVTAQLDSNGDVQAIAKIPELPKAPRLETPSKTFEDIR